MELGTSLVRRSRRDALGNNDNQLLVPEDRHIQSIGRFSHVESL
jgi:hypothetical protein